jgi:hypothetical protein
MPSRVCRGLLAAAALISEVASTTSTVGRNRGGPEVAPQCSPNLQLNAHHCPFILVMQIIKTINLKGCDSAHICVPGGTAQKRQCRKKQQYKNA